VSRPTRVFLSLLAFYSVFFGLSWLKERRLTEVRLAPSKSAFFHDEFVEIRLRALDPELGELWKRSPPVARVLRDGAPVRTIAGLEAVTLVSEEPGIWTGKWPCPWNAPEGPYELVLDGAAKASTARGAVARRLRTSTFRIARRKPAPIPEGLAVLTLETAQPLAEMRVAAPDGTTKDWRGLLDWAEYVGADAFWMLGGQTPGLAPGELWISHNFALLPEVAQECRKRGLQFGVYAMCYLTTSEEKLPRYEYARDVESGKTELTRSISLREPNRVEDVAALLKKIGRIKGVDYLGLDYIRNALGGYELVDDFFAEMPGLKAPAGWDKMSLEERMLFLAKKKVARADAEFIDAWQWWRAHKVAGIVRRIRSEIGPDKKLWAFTLTWDKGWHHGQDPVMMNDAGVDADALMLYQADEDQFSTILRDWNRYVRRSDVQLVAGNIVDWGLHQKSPEGPKAFSRRLKSAVDRVYSDGPARGVFIHDVGRALWGPRLGKWTTREWMDAARDSIRYLKSKGAKADGPPPEAMVRR
jgi:hypothetical protein